MNQDERTKACLLILVRCRLLPAPVVAGSTSQACYESYIQSVIRKDIEGFARTLTSGEVFHYIDSHGQRTDSRQEYLDGHRRWFKEENWEIDYEPSLIVKRGDAAYAMAVFHYRGAQTNGKAAHLDGYFTLILFKENGEWRAVADIGTPITSR